MGSRRRLADGRRLMRAACGARRMLRENGREGAGGGDGGDCAADEEQDGGAAERAGAGYQRVGEKGTGSEACCETQRVDVNPAAAVCGMTAQNDPLRESEGGPSHE